VATIGVLALQGAFARHAEMLAALGHSVVLVRQAGELPRLDGLVLPGGESTVQLQLAARLGIEDEIREMIAHGRPVLATCAGLILLARTVSGPEQRSFDAIDVTVSRNGWGRQLDSFEAPSDEPFEGGAPLPLVCIRAPRILAVGANARILARFRGEPVLVRQGNLVGATFHPELTEDRRVHHLAFERTYTSQAPARA
jgi:pyridoxal 5'-phosphate synthase pdxT subunit